MFRVAVFLIALFGLLSAVVGTAGYWLVSDDSGKYLAALDHMTANQYNVIVSNDYGKTWNSSSASSMHVWIGLATDGSGKKLALSALPDSSGTNYLPYISKDEGATWVEGQVNGGGTPNCYKIASDGTGTNLVVGTFNDIYASTDGGTTWDAQNVASYDYGTDIAYSADGSTVVYSSYQKISMHRAGSFWGFGDSPAASWISLSTSIKGTVGAGSYNIGYYYNAHDDRGVYITKDWVTFTPLVVTSGPTTFNAVSVTDDGSLVYYGGSGGVYVYNVSSNATVHSDLVASTSVAVWSIATSKTGKYAVVGTGANIWTSSNYGKNFKIVK